MRHQRQRAAGAGHLQRQVADDALQQAPSARPRPGGSTACRCACATRPACRRSGGSWPGSGARRARSSSASGPAPKAARLPRLSCSVRIWVSRNSVLSGVRSSCATSDMKSSRMRSERSSSSWVADSSASSISCSLRLCSSASTWRRVSLRCWYSATNTLTLLRTASGSSGLYRKSTAPDLVALEGVVQLAPGGADEHDRDVAGALGAAHQLGQFEAVHARHLHVQDGQRELVFEQQRQRLVARTRVDHHAAARRGSARRAPAGFPAGRRRSGLWSGRFDLIFVSNSNSSSRDVRPGQHQVGRAAVGSPLRGMVGDLRFGRVLHDGQAAALP